MERSVEPQGDHTVSWRNIAIILINDEKGEWKA